MVNSTGEREGRPRMYKKTRVIQQLKHKGEGGEGEDWGGGDGGVKRWPRLLQKLS
jgi:hypothetical protein